MTECGTLVYETGDRCRSLNLIAWMVGLGVSLARSAPSGWSADDAFGIIAVPYHDNVV